MDMTRGANLVATVVLSLFLTRTRLRKALLTHATEDGSAALSGDQRRGVDLAGLTEQLPRLPGPLAREREACRKQAVRFLETAAAGGFVPVTWDDPAFPAHLTALEDRPAVLWLRGDRSALDRPAVAIVGSRRASPYAVQVAEQLAAEVSRHGVTVVSGLARGVDAAAHRGALAGPGSTVAVVGSGVDVVYPSEHAALADRIAGTAGSAVVSELPPGTPPLRHHFPRRNRLISGMSRGVVIVEATFRSGSLITARCAAEQGRDVMAVPGNVLSGRSRGAHALIRDGAKIVETADDILEELGMPAVAADEAQAATRSAEGQPFARGLDPVLGRMDPGEAYSVDELAEQSGMDGVALLRKLTDLEIEGRVLRVANGRFVRTPDRMLT
ncbi:MAG: DNA-protecting protein DprA [Acidobacteria bacterium]|nr:DNA-protecting protein DprA [Acidobacteriota bacterium]MYJ03827.1 DNA-protecting protein DprA [Acidobacteriota bacterium]